MAELTLIIDRLIITGFKLPQNQTDRFGCLLAVELQRLLAETPNTPAAELTGAAIWLDAPAIDLAQEDDLIEVVNKLAGRIALTVRQREAELSIWQPGKPSV